MHILKRTSVIAAVSLVLISVVVRTAHSQSTTFDLSAKAQSLSNMVGSKFGSPEGIRNNAVNPMTTGGTPMTNIGGDVSFDAPLVICPSSNKFLDVTILPGGGGDIDSTFVQQDTDYDSVIDFSYSVPSRISGICGNGIISCDSGTWNNCLYYKWTADAAGKTSLVPVTMQELGGCFCVNNSCGSGLVVNQLSYILTVLGGGVAGAIQAVNPKWAVSNASIDSTTISYYGQNSDQCSSPPSPWASGNPNPQQYYGSSYGALEADAQSEASAQTTRSDSGYSILMNSVAAQSNPSEYRSCSIVNTASVQTDSVAPVFTWLPWLDISVNCFWGGSAILSCFNYDYRLPNGNTFHNDGTFISIDTNSDGIYDSTFNDPAGMPSPANVWLSDWQPTADWLVAQYQSSYGIPYTSIRKKLPASSCNGPSCSAGSECCWYTDGGGSGNFGNYQYYRVQWEKISPPSCPANHQYVSSDVMCYQDVVVRGTVDGCQSMAADPLCRLKAETVDGVSTYSNFSPTSLVPISSCKTITGQLQNYQVCEPWWIKNRTYLCQTASFYDFNDLKERTRNINNSALVGSGFVSYQDKTRNQSGFWSYDSNTVPMNTTSNTDSCMKACKTRKLTTNTQASLSGTTAQSNVSTDTWEFFYRSCPDAACPSGPGEELLIDCQCIDEFSEAASMMEVMNQSGKDLICSSGALQ